MPPCSSLNSSAGNITLADVRCVNPTDNEDQLWEEWHYRTELLFILQNLINCSDTVINILNKTSKVDESKSTQKSLLQHRNVGHSCNGQSLKQESFRDHNDFQPISVCCKFLENRKSLQHGMAQHVCGADHKAPENDSGFQEDSGGLQHHLSVDSRVELEKLEINVLELKQCCFYFGSIDSQTSKDLLRNKPTGTFLIRDSSHFKYLYSLSVKTERGATSVRILYNSGLFQFDSDKRIRDKLPKFDSVLGLLDFHVMVSLDGINKSWQWEETSGRKGMTVTLTKPLRNTVSSLEHLSRVKINQCIDNSFLPHQVDRLPLLSDKLKEFIKDYPYRI